MCVSTNWRVACVNICILAHAERKEKGREGTSILEYYGQSP